MRIMPCRNTEAGAEHLWRQVKGTHTLNLEIQLLAFGLLVILPVARASAQICMQCPTDAQGAAIGASGPSVLVIRAGHPIPVTGGTVGACEKLTLGATVVYNSVGSDGGIGPGFTGGTGRI